MSGDAQRGERLYELGRYQEALAALSRHLAREPEDTRAIGLVAFCHAYLKDHARAQDAARLAIKLDPEDGYPVYVLGLVMSMAGDALAAVSWLRQAVRLDPGNAGYVSALASCYAQSGDWRSAGLAAQRALALDPSDENARAILAHALAIGGRVGEAFDHGLAALALNPEGADALATNGFIALHLGRHNEARRFFEDALRIEPLNEYAQGGMMDAQRYRFPPYRWVSVLDLWLDGKLYGLSGALTILCVLSLFIVTPLSRMMGAPWIAVVHAVAVCTYLLLSIVGRPIVDSILMLHAEARRFQNRDLQWASGAFGVVFVIALAALSFAVAGAPEKGVPALMLCIVWIVVVTRLRNFRSPLAVLRWTVWLFGPLVSLGAIALMVG